MRGQSTAYASVMISLSVAAWLRVSLSWESLASHLASLRQVTVPARGRDTGRPGAQLDSLSRPGPASPVTPTSLSLSGIARAPVHY